MRRRRCAVEHRATPHVRGVGDARQRAVRQRRARRGHVPAGRAGGRRGHDQPAGRGRLARAPRLRAGERPQRRAGRARGVLVGRRGAGGEGRPGAAARPGWSAARTVGGARTRSHRPAARPGARAGDRARGRAARQPVADRAGAGLGVRAHRHVARRAGGGAALRRARRVLVGGRRRTTGAVRERQRDEHPTGGVRRAGVLGRRPSTGRRSTRSSTSPTSATSTTPPSPPDRASECQPSTRVPGARPSGRRSCEWWEYPRVVRWHSDGPVALRRAGGTRMVRRRVARPVWAVARTGTVDVRVHPSERPGRARADDGWGRHRPTADDHGRQAGPAVRLVGRGGHRHSR